MTTQDELEVLRMQVKRLEERLDGWAVNGLSELDTGHGLQRFGGGDLRLDNSGIQVLTSAEDVNVISFVDEFRNQHDDPLTQYPHSLFYGRNWPDTPLHYAIMRTMVDADNRAHVAAVGDTAAKVEIRANNANTTSYANLTPGVWSLTDAWFRPYEESATIASGNITLGTGASDVQGNVIALTGQSNTTDTLTKITNDEIFRGFITLVGNPNHVITVEHDTGGTLYEIVTADGSDYDLTDETYSITLFYNTHSGGNSQWVEVARSHPSGGGMKKTSGGGYYLIPAGPSNGTIVASAGSADTYGSWTEMRSASGNALFIVGVTVHVDTSQTLSTVEYLQVDIGTGAAASETSVGEVKFGMGDLNSSSGESPSMNRELMFPIPVDASTRIACRTADGTGTQPNWEVTLHVIDQADLADL